MKFRSDAPCKTGRRSEVTTVKIAVIGAGASGLLAASMLAKAGAEVTLFERNDRVGKKLSTILPTTARPRKFSKTSSAIKNFCFRQ